MARRLTDLDPFDEIAYRAQMRLHAAASDRAAALHTFHGCANLLQRELGVEPAPETRELYRKLLAHGTPAATRPEELPSPVARGERQSPETWALVGRAAACAELFKAWRTTAPGSPRRRILGEAGTGKSRG
jgi:DNA-binding SARP family transcriptional activator